MSLLFGSGAAAGEVRLGLANPFSGPLAASGERNRVTVDLAVRTLNERGGVLGDEIRLIAADDGCNIEQAASAALDLIKAGVRAVIGHMCSHASLIAAPAYETVGIPMLTPSSTHPRLTEEGRSNVFRLIGRDDDQGRLAGDFLAQLQPSRPIAIVHDGSTYGSGLAWQARAELRRNGIREAVFATYVPGTSDHTTLVGQLAREAIGVLYIAGYAPDAGRIVRQARERGLELQVAGGDGLGGPEFWTEAGDAGEGTRFSARPDPSTSPEAGVVVGALKALGIEMPSDVLAAYAAVQVWAEAARRTGSTDPVAVTAALHRGRFETVLGRVSFDERGDLVGASWRWRVWREGRQVSLPPTMAMRLR
ncbi:MAG: branched-chain amino acid ABC transporter substrate-binding protein [Geminicoccaceae bacterium]